MKKTLCVTLAVLGLLTLTGRDVQAQGTANGGVNLVVRTIDRAVLDAAWLYAATPGVNYFVDSAHLAADYTGTALPIDSLGTVTPLTIENGFFITGSADTATYRSCFVLAHDANNRYYVLAGGTEIDKGVFQSLPLFLGGDSINNAGFPMTSTDNILMGSPAVIRDNELWEYTSMTTAVNWANISMGINMLTFIDSVSLDNAVTVTRSFDVNQNGHAMVNNVTSGSAFKVSGSNDVNWMGGIANIVSNAGTGVLFELADNSMLSISSVSATAAGNVVKMTDASHLIATSCSFTTNDAAGAVILAEDNSSASIDVVNFYGGANGIALAEGSHCVVSVLENTVLNRMSGYSQPLTAYSYTDVDNGYRLYASTLRQVADSANGGAVYLVADIPAGVKDTLASPAMLQATGYSIADTLRVENAVGTVAIVGGTIEAVTCSTDDAPLALSVDSLGYLNPGFHNAILLEGRYVAIDQIAGASVSIRGGKYGSRYDSYLAPRFVFVENTDADAATFPWKVEAGYTVTWKNYDFMGNDTTILYNEPDNKIRPVLSSPRYPDSDTIFIAWWADSLFTTPWDFLRDTLSGPDTLWAQWHKFDPLTEAYYYVYHRRLGITSDDDVTDTVRYFAAIGGTDTIVALHYAFYTAVTDTVFLSPVVADTVINMDYVRDTFQLTWNLVNGSFEDGHPLVERLAWGTPIVYPADPVRRGYTFNGWANNPTVMPTFNLTVRATWSHTPYPLTWVHADDTLTYTSYPIDEVRATFTHDDIVDTAILNFLSHVDGQVYDLPTRAGGYTVIARPQDTVFLLSDTVHFFTIARAPIDVTGFEVEKEKFYDGTDSAVIVTMGTVNGVLGNDEVFLADAHARFTDASVGENKGVIVYYGVAGVNVANYDLDTTAQLLHTDGAILAPFVVDSTAEGQGIAVNARGYCVGSDTIRYYLESGSGVPDEYNLIFAQSDVDNQGFVNAGWQSLDAANPGVIIMDIPATAAAGLYGAKLVFRNSSHPDLVSDTSRIGFIVNLPETYTMPLFSDVIALVDTCDCFTDIHWFHSTDGGATWTEVTEAQGKYYYQEEGGLTGQYYVAAKMNGVAMFTCPQDDVTTLLADDNTPAATVNVYPNPAADRATVTISNSQASSHTLRVMSIMGVEMENTTFNGESIQLDLRGYANGSYTVSVDGIVVRVIKK